MGNSSLSNNYNTSKEKRFLQNLKNFYKISTKDQDGTSS